MSSSQQLIDGIASACCLVGEDCTILNANAAAARLFACAANDLAGRRLTDFCHSGDFTIVSSAVLSSRQGNRSAAARFDRDDGSTFTGEIIVSHYAVCDSEDDCILVLLREVDEGFECYEYDLELQHLMLEESVDGISAHTLEGELLFGNKAAEEQWGKTVQQLRDEGPWAWVEPALRGDVPRIVQELRSKGHLRFETHRVTDAGELYREISARVVHTWRGDVCISVMRDISERVRSEKVMRHLAYHDLVTDLGNRALLHKELARAIAEAERHGDLLGVIFLDVDGLKPINDTYGHPTGDVVLRRLAGELKSSLRECDTIARVGGDEFVVVLPRLAQASDLNLIAEKLMSHTSRTMRVGGSDIDVSMSAGVALHHSGDDVDSLITRADLHMYALREQRREKDSLAAG